MNKYSMLIPHLNFTAAVPASVLMFEDKRLLARNSATLERAAASTHQIATVWAQTPPVRFVVDLWKFTKHQDQIEPMEFEHETSSI